MPDDTSSPRSYASRPERAGRKGVLVYLPNELVRQLKILAATNEVTMQSLVEDAVMDSLAKAGVKVNKSARPRESEPLVGSGGRKRA